VRPAFAEGWDLCKPDQHPETNPRKKPPPIGDPPTALLSRARARTEVYRVRSTTTRFGQGIRLLAEPRAVFTETAGGGHDRLLTNLAEPAGSTRNERIFRLHTGEGWKNSRRARDPSGCNDRAPRLWRFEPSST